MEYLALTQKGVESYKNALHEIGWFTLTQNDEEKTSKRLNELSTSPDYLMHALVHFDFDSEIMDLEDDYTSILNQIIQLANLNVLSKSVELKEDTLRINLTTERDTYTYSVDTDENGSWIDSDFIDEFIPELLEGEDCDSELFPLPGSDQTVQYVFVPEEMYDKALEIGVISDDMYLFSDY